MSVSFPILSIRQSLFASSVYFATAFVPGIGLAPAWSSTVTTLALFFVIVARACSPASTLRSHTSVQTVIVTVSVLLTAVQLHGICSNGVWQSRMLQQVGRLVVLFWLSTRTSFPDASHRIQFIAPLSGFVAFLSWSAYDQEWHAGHFLLLSVPIWLRLGIEGCRQLAAYFDSPDLHFERLMGKSFEAFIVIDEDGVVRYWNEQATRIFEWTAMETVGRELDDLIVPVQFRKAHAEGIKRYLKTGIAPLFGRFVQVSGVTKSGNVVQMELSVTPLHFRNRVRFCAFVRDITDKLKQSDDLRKARDEAIKAARAKTQFLANISHETRTPLNAILGISDAILEDDSLLPQHREALTILRRSGFILLELINDILDLTKVESGEVLVKNAEFHLLSVVENCGDIVGELARQKNVQMLLSVSKPLVDVGTLCGDAQKLSSIITNILGNAVKYTDSGTVQLRAYTSRTSLMDDSGSVNVTFEITDTGIGMTEDVMANIFLPFWQADASSTRRFGGSGLGLTIASKFIEVMGGTVNLESKLHHGSRFTVMLPFTIPHYTLDLFQDRRIDTTCSCKHIGIFGLPDDMQTMVAEYARALEIPITALEETTEVSSGTQEMDVICTALLSSTPAAVSILAGRLQSAESARVIILYRVRDTGLAQSLPENDRLVFPCKQSQFADALQRCSKDRRSTVLECQDHDTRQFGPEQLNAAREPDACYGKLLVAEDNTINQRVMSVLLSKLGFRVDIASTGKEACALVEANHDAYGMVLMDVQMPEMDGVAAAASIREWETSHQTGRLPILAVTACAMDEDRERCLDAGMEDYISKPVRLEMLRKLTFKYFRNLRQPQQAACSFHPDRFTPAPPGTVGNII
eukprot:ANDGO_03006.mRNA.1 Hybrid signal transduction histidine kinase J